MVVKLHARNLIVDYFLNNPDKESLSSLTIVTLSQEITQVFKWQNIRIYVERTSDDMINILNNDNEIFASGENGEIILKNRWLLIEDKPYFEALLDSKIKALYLNLIGPAIEKATEAPALETTKQ